MPTRTDDEDRIRALIERRVRAVHDRDVAAATADQAADIVLFDAVAPLRYTGLATARERTRTWFSLYEGSIGYQIRDLDICVDGAVAFTHYLYRVTGTMTSGSRIEMWVRATLGLREIDGAWRIVHEHDSVPFDGGTGKAALDLEP